MIKVLSDEVSVVNQYLHELRDVNIQKDAERFRNNVERIGMIAGFEASKLFSFEAAETVTPLGKADTQVLKDKIILNTVLRAGLPLQQGIHKVLNMAELSFIAAGRKPETAAGVEIDLSYVATPPIEGKVLIIADTMIATGKSLVDAYRALVDHYGTPSRTIIIGVIASQQGIDYVSDNIQDADIIVGAVDKELDHNFFIVPGLGDAGDLMYGPKSLKLK